MLCGIVVGYAVIIYIVNTSMSSTDYLVRIKTNVPFIANTVSYKHLVKRLQRLWVKLLLLLLFSIFFFIMLTPKSDDLVPITLLFISKYF